MQSVTAFGRMMIEQTKNEVENKYRVENGFSHDAKVHTIKQDSLSVSLCVNQFVCLLFFVCAYIRLFVGDIRRHRFGDGEVWSVDCRRSDGARTRSSRLRFCQIYQTYQTRVRESVLPLSSHQQKEVQFFHCPHCLLIGDGIDDWMCYNINLCIVQYFWFL